MNKNLKEGGGSDKTESLSSLVKRRAFLQYSGAGLAASAFVFGACQETTVVPSANSSKNANAAARTSDGNTVYLGSGDIGILNYAYALEQLEAAFYTMAVAEEGFNSMYSEEEQMILKDLKDHEIIHREFLKAALGDNAIPGLSPNFSTVDFSSRDNVLATARVFEDLGVAAYNGAGQLLQNVDFLLVAGKIVSVEARHASAIRDVINPLSMDFAGDDVINEQGLDRAMMPPEVLAAAQPFINETIDGSDLPTS
jgi:hypothetical protein